MKSSLPCQVFKESPNISSASKGLGAGIKEFVKSWTLRVAGSGLPEEQVRQSPPLAEFVLHVDFKFDPDIKEVLSRPEKFDVRTRILGIVFMGAESLIHFLDQHTEFCRAWLKSIECQKSGGDLELGPRRLIPGLFNEGNDGFEQLLGD